MTTNTISRAQELRIALGILKQIKAQYAEWEEDRRDNGWTSRNPTCKHGTYIGDPYGADYLCGYCEDGTSEYELALGQAHKIVQDDRADLEALEAAITGAIRLASVKQFRYTDLYDKAIEFGAAVYERKKQILAKYE